MAVGIVLYCIAVTLNIYGIDVYDQANIA